MQSRAYVEDYDSWSSSTANQRVVHLLPQSGFRMAHWTSEWSGLDSVGRCVRTEFAKLGVLMVMDVWSYRKDILLIAGSFVILGSTISGTQVFGYAIALTVHQSLPQHMSVLNVLITGPCTIQNSGIERRTDRQQQIQHFFVYYSGDALQRLDSLYHSMFNTRWTGKQNACFPKFKRMTCGWGNCHYATIRHQ